jgi:hypothetical protein
LPSQSLSLALLWLRLNTFAAQRGWISSDFSRKIIHMGTGPLFVLCWLLFRNSQLATLQRSSLSQSQFSSSWSAPAPCMTKRRCAMSRTETAAKTSGPALLWDYIRPGDDPVLA